jgi:acyl homoserine lactone synthase
VESSDPGDLAQGNLNMVTFQMIRLIVEFAESRGIRHYVTVTSVAVERLMKQAGIYLRRFGDGKAERVGKVLTVACWVDVGMLRQAVDALPTDLPREAA